MSNQYYNELWNSVYNDVEKLRILDDKIQVSITPKSNEIALQEILPIYLRYRNIIERLIWCYDQQIQSQKRQFIKKLLDCSIGRMLEYKREIVKLNYSEHEWPDDLLIKLKWTPDDIRISRPSSYVKDRQDQLEKRRQLIDNLIADKESEKKLNDRESSNKIPSTSAVKLNLVEAVLIIQSHERARVGRKIAIKAKNEYEYKKKLERGEIEMKRQDSMGLEKAALIIQRIWRGYIARKNIEQHLNKIEQVVGMRLLYGTMDKKVLARSHQEKNIARQNGLQKLALLKIAEAIERERAQMCDLRKKALDEDIAEEIYKWFKCWYDALDHFDIFLSAKSGGAVPVITDCTLTPEEFAMKQSMPTEAKKQKKNKSKKKKKEELTEGWLMPESKVSKFINDIKREFEEIWSFEVDSDGQVHMDLIRDDIYYKLQSEIREIVDQMMQLELDRHNSALETDHKRDKLPFKIPGMKKKKKKKKKLKKKKKKKIIEAIVSPEEIDDMFKELISAGIIRNYPSVNIDQWIGDLSYQNYEAKKNFQAYHHRLGEIKQLIIDYCILPLGTKEIHSLAPLVKSVCIVGLPRTGKSFLAHAICSETGALLFDLSSKNLASQYEGEKNEKKLMKMIGILARHSPPAVIIIDGGDKPWWKKLPPTEQPAQQRRLAKILPKFIKSIKGGDQILILGLVSEPWKSKKRFYKIYNKFIIIPSTDYNTLYLFYRNILGNYHGVDYNFDISSLAKVSIGYPLDVIRETINKVLNIRRRIRLKFQPLLSEEILTELIKWTSPENKVTKQLERFEGKTPLGRKKRRMMGKIERNEIK